MDDAVEHHRQYLRMSRESFDHLLTLVSPYITKQDTNMREAIPPGLKLVVTLHHLASGNSHIDIAHHYRLGRSTVGEIIYDVSEAIWKVLQPQYLRVPCGPEEWKSIANE